MDIDAYLRRIGYDGPRAPRSETLRKVHHAHMLAVPFENLDVGRTPIVANEQAVVRKIVDRRRGGFCYELNGAFAALLRAMGFDVTLLSARVARESGGFGPDFDHLTLLVSTGEETWLADVGFGDSFVQPLPFVAGVEHDDPAGGFRIDADDEWLVLMRLVDGAPVPQYRFSLVPRVLADFAGMCHYHQTSPKSSFTQKRVCSRATPDGRITLTGHKLITTRGGERVERAVSDQEWPEVLRAEFGITLPGGPAPETSASPQPP